jgi:hypothetical protein
MILPPTARPSAAPDLRDPAEAAMAYTDLAERYTAVLKVRKTPI